MTFETFFHALWSCTPFRWQTRLAERVIKDGWPGGVGMPTAAGKTALIDIALYALVQGAASGARRIFFVVDRRVIVDEAAKRAHDISEVLCRAVPGSPAWDIAEALRGIGGEQNQPLATSVLRGGIPKEGEWADSPLQPVVVCSTVDQIGSALLFRAYGASEFARPIRAGLAAFDSLLILDEAHTAQAFAETLGRIREYAKQVNRNPARPLQVVEMSATPRNGGFHEEDEDLEDDVLKDRWYAEKRAELVVAETKEGDSAESGGFRGLIDGLVESARRMRDEHGARVVGIIANRVATARAVHARLAAEAPQRAVLLTGRARPWDRDRIWMGWRDRIALGRAEGVPAEPIFVVATQCIEVGANVDFDALVTECASVDALEQRFGRLNRGGRKVVSRAAIVAQKDQTGSRAEDAVYGKALTSTWAWLKKREVKKAGPKKRKETWVPMGTMELRDALKAAENRNDLVMPRLSAPTLLPAHMDLFCQTSPAPAVSPEPSVFLHGPARGPADVQVVWRADLPQEIEAALDAVEVCPPSAAEAIGLPVWAVRRWLSGLNTQDVSDLEGAPEPKAEEKLSPTKVLRWRGPDDSAFIRVQDIRPGMMIVVPSESGGCDEWGWNPDSTDAVKDVGDAVKLLMRRPVLRVGPELAVQWGYADLAARLREPDLTREDVLATLRGAALPEELVSKIVSELLTAGRRWRFVPALAVVGKGYFDQSSARSAHIGEETPLTEHLERCEEMAKRFAAAVTDPEVKGWIMRAARLHDIGKADPRFQAWLRGGNPIYPKELIAKSEGSALNRRAIERARRLAGYPKGGRHEVMSAALLGTTECDGVLHLVASHHGRCRPFAPCITDENPVDVRYEGWSGRSDHGLERAGSGVASRFWRLNREFGWYGLAFLEAVLRLADHRQSEKEQEEERRTANA